MGAQMISDEELDELDLINSEWDKFSRTGVYPSSEIMKLVDKWRPVAVSSLLISEIRRLRAALEEISNDKVHISCPDNKPGCCVIHYEVSPMGRVAREALEGK